MTRKQARSEASQEVVLEPVQLTCRACGNRMRMARHSRRTVTTLQEVTHLTLKVYRCRNAGCPRFRSATQPEEEGRWALPHGEFGLDVIALVGTLRYQEQRSIPQIHQELQRRGVQIASRTVTDQLYRYEELLALHLADPKRLQERLGKQEQMILALDEFNQMSGMKFSGFCATVVREKCYWRAVCWGQRNKISFRCSCEVASVCQA